MSFLRETVFSDLTNPRVPESRWEKSPSGVLLHHRDPLDCPSKDEQGLVRVTGRENSRPKDYWDVWPLSRMSPLRASLQAVAGS